MFIILFIFFFSIILCFCVDKNTNSILGRIKILINNMINIIFLLIPKFIRIPVENIINFLLYKPNPTIQIIYIILVSGLYYIFYIEGIPCLTKNCSRCLSKYILYQPYIFLLISIYYFYKACTVDPGIITNKNHEIIDNFRNHVDDNDFYKLLKNESDCKFCNFKKILRSKHCNICQKCIDCFDHHCIWINQCVGLNNYFYFLMFLLSHIILTFTLVIIGILISYNYIIENDLFKVKFFNKITNETYENNIITILQYMIFKFYSFYSCFIIIAVVYVLLLGFFLYHVYLINIGLTSDENNKRIKYLYYLKKLKQYLLEFKKTFNKATNDNNNHREFNFIKYKNIFFTHSDFDRKNISEFSYEEIEESINFCEYFEILLNHKYKNNFSFQKKIYKIIFPIKNIQTPLK